MPGFDDAINQYLGSTRTDQPALRMFNAGADPSQAAQQAATAMALRHRLSAQGRATATDIIYPAVRLVPEKIRAAYRLGTSPMAKMNPAAYEQISEGAMQAVMLNARDLVADIGSAAAEPLQTFLTVENHDTVAVAAYLLGTSGVFGPSSAQRLESAFNRSRDVASLLATAAALANNGHGHRGSLPSAGGSPMTAADFLNRYFDQEVPDWRRRYESVSEVVWKNLPTLIATRFEG